MVCSKDMCFISSGSVGYLTASELHVLVMSTNQNLCVRYSFEEKLLMRSPTGEKVGGLPQNYSAFYITFEPYDIIYLFT